MYSSCVCTGRSPMKARLADAYFEAFVVNGGEVLDWINSGCIDAPDRMPAGSMVAEGQHRIEQSSVWRKDAQEVIDRVLAAVAQARKVRSASLVAA